MENRVNLGFVDDEDKPVKTEEQNEIPPPQVDPIVIDYTKPKVFPQIFAGLVAAYSSLLLGTAFGWSSAVQAELRGLSVGNQSNPQSIWFMIVDDDEMSWVGSLLNIGALMGAISGAFLMDSYGRRMTMILMSFPFITGGLLITLAVHPYMLYCGRIVLGFATGVCSVIVPCYIGEISTPSMRGTIGFFFAMFVPFGLLTVSIMGVGLDWRWISGICTIEPVLFLLGSIFIPESPYFYAKNGRSDDAMKSLQWLRGVDYNCKEELTQLELRVENDAKETARLSDLTHSWVYKPVLISVALMILQQGSGLNVANFNAADIVRMSNPTTNGNVGVMWINVVQTITAVLSCFLVKKFTRRSLFVSAEVTAGSSMMALGLFFYLNDGAEEIRFAWLPLVSLVVFYVGITMGLGPIPWSMPSEILPAKFRGLGSSLIVIVSFGTSFIVTKTFVDMQREMTNAGVFWFYGAFSLLGILFGLFIMPETKDRTYDEIQALFRDPSKFTVPSTGVNPLA